VDHAPVISFGVLTLQDRPWAELVEQWRWLEELGCDTAWVADHFVSPVDAESDWFEGWTLLAALATQTSSMRIGALVSSMTLRNPALLARQALTVDHISGGRLELGLGSAGRTPNDHLMTGIPALSTGERISRFGEVVELVRRLLHDRVTTFEGEHHRVAGAIMAPPSVQRPAPPLVVAAIGPRTMRIAARFADRWNTMIGSRTPWGEVFEELRQRAERFSELCVEVGRDPDAVGRSLLAYSPYLPDDLWRSETAFADLVGTCESMGFTELSVDLPPPALRERFEDLLARQLTRTGVPPR
jgi:alkanesulfonate monooxygenase SsuD/methylene tetrahydromethanopterin reductase-like flavin-dependent oxidoreductase (luciferase family)